MIALHREAAPLALRNKTRRDQARQRLVVRWRVGPHIGLGEATPLEGWGSPPGNDDTLELAESELRAFDARVGPEGVGAWLDRMRSPSARFALELAAFDLQAQRSATSFRETVRRALGVAEPANHPLANHPLEHAALVDMREPTIPTARTLKIKLGIDLDRELVRAAEIRAARPDAILRFDANGALGDRVDEVLARLAELGAELIEEPGTFVHGSPVPVALDESLATLSADRRRELYASGAVTAIVLKPMALGGVRRCLELAREAAAFGVWSIASHLWTGGIARRGEAAMAELVDGLVDRPRAHGLGWSPRDRRLDVDDAARDAPDAPALIDAEGSLSWRELAARVAECRATLPPSSVRVAVEPRVDRASVVSILAAIDHGNPLVLLHPSASERQKASRRARAGCPEDAAGAGSPHDAHADIADEAPLALAFTSGTSGEPKIAVLSRRAMIAAADASADRLGWRDDDRWLLSLPPAHVGGLSVIVRCLLARKPIVLAPPERMREAIEQHRATLVSIVPTMLHRWLHEGWRAPESLRVVLVGGAPCSESLRARALAAGFPVATTYGLTETCGQVATRLPDEDEPGVGRPLSGVEVRVVDGRILVRGTTLMDGYLDAEAPLDEWFDTGDFGTLVDGRLQIRGRRTDLIVTGGENVYPAMVEPRLVGGPIESACVFGVPDPEWGELVAAAVTGHDDAAVLDSLRRACADLARHERPRVFACLDELPRTESGKVDRRALARATRGRLRRL